MRSAAVANNAMNRLRGLDGVTPLRHESGTFDPPGRAAPTRCGRVAGPVPAAAAAR